MNKENKDIKIQVLLSPTDHHKLKTVILNCALASGKLMTSSAYVRDLILNHIKDCEGEQNSCVKEDIKKIYENRK